MTLTPQLSALLPKLSPADRASLLAETKRILATRLLYTYTPYAKQKEFHAVGLKRERLFMAGNQLGKTVAGSFECAMHATGRYPDWWTGRRWDRPTVGWAAGVTGESTRDNPQRLLLGRVEPFGTGAIPAADFISATAGMGITGLKDTITVRHVSGGVSTIGLKSYEKGREKWQGETLDYVWFDEEPPQEIYTEGLTRTNATGGCVWMTFTPLLGMSDVVMSFLGKDKTEARHVTTMTIDDAEHYTPEQRAEIIAAYPPHEREARAKGIPTLGSGRVFPVSEESISCDPFEIPKNWTQIGGLDFGYDHPFAAVKLAWDRDADCLYVTACYRQRETIPAVHASAMRAWGTWLPWAWPHDGLQHDKGSGVELAQQYRKEGLALTLERATFDDGKGFGVEAGVTEMLQRMQTGRWKVFRHMADWFEEFRLYHREDGEIVKLRDDLLSASRYAMMMRRFAVPDAGEWGKTPNYKNITRGIV